MSENIASARVYLSDCFDAFPHLDDNSIDAVVTDPPYFLDGLAGDWSDAIQREATTSTTVMSLPVGMRFNSSQGLDFQQFMRRVATEALRVLKPGGFFLAMSAPRLYHRLGVGVEDAGFEIRDMWTWLYTQNQVKAMSVARFVERYDLPDHVREELLKDLQHWKTPQVKSCLEPIVFAQKPRTDADGNPATFLDNWLRHRVGLVDLDTDVGRNGGMVTANVITTELICDEIDRAFLVPKPKKQEKGDTAHLSVKPLALMDQLIRATVPRGGVVLDPFNGSGSTGVSALSQGRSYIGYERQLEYFEQSRSRFAAAFSEGEWETGDSPTAWWQVSAGYDPAAAVPATRNADAPQHAALF